MGDAKLSKVEMIWFLFGTEHYIGRDLVNMEFFDMFLCGWFLLMAVFSLVEVIVKDWHPVEINNKEEK